MREYEAVEIATRLCHSWPRSSISADMWANELARLDRGRAEHTARQLVRTHDHAPSIAAFLSAYRALAGTATDERICPDCANNGWVTDNDHPAHWPGKTPPPVPEWWGRDDGCCCNVVRPCRCPHGINAANARKKGTDEP